MGGGVGGVAVKVFVSEREREREAEGENEWPSAGLLQGAPPG